MSGLLVSNNSPYSVSHITLLVSEFSYCMSFKRLFSAAQSCKYKDWNEHKNKKSKQPYSFHASIE
jgi:hypothetical protein